MVLPVFLLSACLGGGGSFDLDSVDTEAPRAAPKYQDVPSKKPEARKDQGGYGFAMRFKRRNRHPMAMPKENEVKLKDDDWEATGLPGDPKDLPGRQKSVIDEVSDNGNNDIYFSPYLKPSNHFLSDDQKVAVVGSAKTKDNTANGNTPAVSSSAGAAAMPSETGLTTVLDAVELKSDGKKVENLDNFSDATRLVVDGIMIPLLPNDSESGGSHTDKGENGKTAFTYETTYTPESDKKDTKAQTGAGGMQTVSNTAGGTSGKTKTHYKVQVCCSNLNYLKYGLLTRENNNSVMQAVKNSNQTAARTAQGAQSMFLQGERTDEKEIPKEQNVVYLGTWYGHIAANGTSWTGNASDQQSGNRARFDVNFKDKKIIGTLTAENRSEATFTIDAMIDGNGFKGKAKTGNDGFAPDQNSSTGTHKVHIANAEVRGGFYGPEAEEMGGWFAYPGNGQAKNAQTSPGNGNSAGSATVVFGAKRQRLVK